MLKTKIIEILRGTLPSGQDTANLDALADKILEAFIAETAQITANVLNSLLEDE